MNGKITKSNFANGYLNIIDAKYTGFNPILKLISRIKFNRACKRIFNTSPSFGQLWSFADFIKLAEEVFFFNNNSKSQLYSSWSYKVGENGFVITSEADHVTLIVKLYSDNQCIAMDIKRTNGTNRTTNMLFENGDWSPDKERKDTDIILLDNVIGIINRHIIMLLEYCYKRRGSEDYEKLIPRSDKEF